jgi:guanosine-3',5'-bis(diphosphate) 3'-pyrophosphohydrolase
MAPRRPTRAGKDAGSVERHRARKATGVFPEQGLTDLLSAFRYVAEKHRDQRRKNVAASPYINHLIEVLETLWRIGGVRDPVTLVAALLHDALEDTAATAEEIQTLFSADVLTVVREVSDDKRLPRAERKRLQIEQAAGKSRRAKEVQLADKVANVRDITHSPPQNWPRERQAEYVDWASCVVDGLRGTNPDLESLFDRLVAEARAALRGPGES